MKKLMAIACAFSALILAQIVWRTLNFGYFFWDYFTSADMFMAKIDYRNIAVLFENWWQAFWFPGLAGGRNSSTYVLHLNSYFLLFGGNFWMFYVVKWLFFFASIWVVERILKRIDVSGYSRLAAVVFLLFHTSHPVLMLFSWDIYAGFYFLLTVWIATYSDTTLLELSRSRYLALCVAAFLLSGAKETGPVMLSLSVAIWLILDWTQLRATFDQKRSILLLRYTGLLPATGMAVACLIYPLWKTLGTANEKIHWVSVAKVILTSYKLMVPIWPWYFGHIVVFSLLALAVYWACYQRGIGRSRFSHARKKVLFASMTISIVLPIFLGVALAINPIGGGTAAARYVVPAVFALALCLGTIFSMLPDNVQKFAAPIFAIASVLFCVGDISRQVLAYDIHSESVSYTTTALRQLRAEGKEVTIDPGLWPEWATALNNYFIRDGVALYGHPSGYEKMKFSTEVTSDATLLMTYPREDPFESGEQVEWCNIVRLAPERPSVQDTLFYKITHVLSKVDALWRSTRAAKFTRYDKGAPVLAESSTLTAMEPNWIFYLVFHGPCRSKRELQISPIFEGSILPHRW